MIVINGTVEIQEGTLEQARDAIETMVTKSRAEDGCIGYSFAQDLLDPNTLHIVERWRDEEALGAHFQSAHMAEFQAAAGGFSTGKLDVRRWETDEGTSMG